MDVKSRVRVIAGAGLAIAIIGGTAGITLARDDDHTLYRADVMAGVTAPYTGTGNAIRGITGGAAPWVIAHSDIEVRTSGSVDVEVEGLVIGPTGPAQFAGKNPVLNQKVIVSCLSTDAAGAATTVNASSETFPVDAAGNGEGRVHVDLPSPCYAPIVFVASAGGNWFAVSGA